MFKRSFGTFSRIKKKAEEMVRKGSSSSNPRDDRPCFCKLISNPPQEELRIPQEFVEHIVEDAARTAILKGPTGKDWNLQLRKEGNELYYHGGWSQFLRDENLKEGDFLLFTYDGRRTFHVRIFNDDGLER